MAVQDTYLASNLFPSSTGLPFTVWIPVKGNARHDVRVKVSLSDNLISVGIRPAIRVVHGEMGGDDLKLLERWVLLNRETIIRYWDGEIDTVEAITSLRKITD